MISREDYLKAYEIVIKYKAQCENDLKEINNIDSSSILFKDIASQRLYKTVKESFMIFWDHELSVAEVRFEVGKRGIDDFKKLRGMGEKVFSEFKNILYDF